MSLRFSPFPEHHNRSAPAAFTIPAGTLRAGDQLTFDGASLSVHRGGGMIYYSGPKPPNLRALANAAMDGDG